VKEFNNSVTEVIIFLWAQTCSSSNSIHEPCVRQTVGEHYLDKCVWVNRVKPCLVVFEKEEPLTLNPYNGWLLRLNTSYRIPISFALLRIKSDITSSTSLKNKTKTTDWILKDLPPLVKVVHTILRDSHCDFVWEVMSVWISVSRHLLHTILEQLQPLSEFLGSVFKAVFIFCLIISDIMVGLLQIKSSTIILSLFFLGTPLQ
jgi:hypothetical protein